MLLIVHTNHSLQPVLMWSMRVSIKHKVYIVILCCEIITAITYTVSSSYGSSCCLVSLVTVY